MHIINLCIHHKESDALKKAYQHLQVGAEVNEKIANCWYDDSGENISYKNKQYSELTGLYWFWKNKAHLYDAVIINHYRREFVDATSKPLTNLELEQYLTNFDCIAPYPKKYPLSLYDVYNTMHYKKDIDIMCEIVCEKYPCYQDIKTFYQKNNTMCLWNMFGLKTVEFNKMMEFIFSVLFEVEKRIDISNYSVQQQRVFGFLSERLIAYYLMKNFKKIKYVNVKFQDKNDKIHIFSQMSKVWDVIYFVQKPFHNLNVQILKKIKKSKSK